MTDLGRIVDPNELNRADGRRGRLIIDVPAEWLGVGDTVELVAPTRLVCARCEGGGCDRCDRSGAIRLSDETTARTIRLTLPRTTSSRVVVRLVRPLGDEAGLDQLTLEIRESTAPSPICRRVEPATRPVLAPRTMAIAMAIALVFALAVALGVR